MATRPSFVPTFATGGSRRLEPDAGEKSNGFREGFRFPPRKANWALGLVADWAAWAAALLDANEEHTYQTPKTRKLVVPLWAGVTYEDSWSKAANPQSAYYWEKGDSALTRRIVFPLGALLRDGMTISAVKMLIAPGDGRVSGNASIGLYYANPSHGTPAIPSPTGVGTAGASSGTSLQVVSATLGGSHTVVREGDNGRDYWVEILGTDATTLTGGAGRDRLYGVELTVTDPGPRNV